MNFQREHSVRRKMLGFDTAPKRSEDGSVTLIFITLLAIMMILVTAQSRELLHLRRETKFIEQQQINRLNLSQTNAVTVTEQDSK